jgi:hypothetical protein
MSRWISPPVAFVIADVAMWWIGRTVEFGRFQFASQSSCRSTLRAHDRIVPMRIELERPDHADVAELVAELDAYQATLYPPEGR